MQIFQRYYTAESQDIPITVKLTLKYQPATFEQQIFVFSLKVISDVTILKTTSQSNRSVRNQRGYGDMGYTPIITTIGRGGSIISNPFEYVKSFIPSGWEGGDVPDYNPATFLSAFPYVSNVSASPAGDSSEITITSSLYLAAPMISISASEPLPPP